MLCVYATKHGSTECIAKKIFGSNGNVKIIKLPMKENDDEIIEREKEIYILFPLYYGAPVREAEKFLNSNLEILINKRVTIGIVGENPDIYGDVETFKRVKSKEKIKKRLGGIDERIVEMSEIILFKGIVDEKKLSLYEKKCNTGKVDNNEQINKFYKNLDLLELSVKNEEERMSYFEKFKDKMMERYDKSKESEFVFLFKVIDCAESIIIKVQNKECNIFKETDDNIYEYDLVVEGTKEIFERIVDEKDELTGVDAYFEGDVELEGDRSYLEDMFEVFGIV